ncbi:PaaI family thioesterase [Abyssicoccus albus]|uniref:PaaI family thioesterase n=1 Tax=Abyssicoccus albus TaxID=1817405 RepID=UPI00097E3D06|nr:PaaI family thioesterase [Abyssicoccus albus]AQL55781.1 thioesterase [Abyssicoccus albus]
MNNFVDLFEIKQINHDQTNGIFKFEMPITDICKQPFGYLHGGVSVAFAETACSMAAMEVICDDQIAFGLEINANHVKSKREGILYATAKSLHIGKSSHVWSVEITDEADELICVSRCTMAIRNK